MAWIPADDHLSTMLCGFESWAPFHTTEGELRQHDENCGSHQAVAMEASCPRHGLRLDTQHESARRGRR